MKNKIVYWVLTALVALVFIASAIGKFTADQEALKMGAGFGLSPQTFTILGIIEIVAAILFIIPRTAIIGTLLLVAYMGGAIATHLEHNLSFTAQCAIQAFIWIVAVYRFPELRLRILGRKVD
jgi:uncharacterized membrane protein YphA (DoxX/SURF4 family)